MPIFKTPFNGYSVKFSPFYENRLAVATSQNFGILGNGRLHVLDLSAYDTADGVYDLTWSESHDSLLVAAVADGSVKLYDLALPPTSNPIRSFQEHTREAHSAVTPSSPPPGTTPSSFGPSTAPPASALLKNTLTASTPPSGTLATPMSSLPHPAIARSESGMSVNPVRL